MKRWTLMPGAEVVEIGDLRVQIGLPPCIKLWLQRRLPPPRVLVLPDEFYRRGVVQVCLEFYVYHFLFIAGKALGKLPESDKLIVIGTSNQLQRVRRVLDATLNGFTAQTLASWTGPNHRRLIPDKTVNLLRNIRAWFSPKVQDWPDLKRFVEDVAETGRINPQHAERLPPLVRAFVQKHGNASGDEMRLLAAEFAILLLEDVIDFRAYDANDEAELGASARIRHLGGNRFQVDEEIVDLNFEVDQAPWLITLPPASTAVVPSALQVLCLGSDSGFEVEHPTTGFAICINGHWAIIDAPVCASYLLQQYGIDPADVRVILETHGHEDHMGSAIHFLLDCITSGHAYVYVAAEPVYRTCVIKVASILDISDEEAERLLDRNLSRSRGVIRVRPGVPLRLLGATWHFAWMIHPIPTVGFRIEVTQAGRTHSIAYSADTAPQGGASGVRAMVAAGYLDPHYDPFQLLVHGNEDLVFWEAGGTSGDPVHFDAREWEPQCAARNIHPTVVFMHAHPMPPELRHHALARPGMVWNIVGWRPVRTAWVVKLTDTLHRRFKLADPTYWLWTFLCQGELRALPPDSTVVAEGETGDAWYIVLQGECEVFVGRNAVGRLGAGAFFGELSLLDDGRRKATVRSLSPIVLLRVPRDVFREFVVTNDLWSFFHTFWQDVRLLSQTRLFLGFPHEVVSDLARSCEHRKYAAGSVIIEQGAIGHELFVVMSGQISIVRENVPVLTRGPGEVIGEYGVLVPGARRFASVVADTDVQVLVLTGETLDRLLSGQIPLQLRLVAMLKDRGLPVPALGGSTEGSIPAAEK